jgi:hypothetical protein
LVSGLERQPQAVEILVLQGEEDVKTKGNWNALTKPGLVGFMKIVNFEIELSSSVSPTLPIGALDQQFSPGAGPKMRVESTAPVRKSLVV